MEHAQIARTYRALAARAEGVARKMELHGMNASHPRSIAAAFLLFASQAAHAGGDFPEPVQRPLPDVDPNPGRPPFEEPRFPAPGGPSIPSAPPQLPTGPQKILPPVPTPPVLKMPPSRVRPRPRAR